MVERPGIVVLGAHRGGTSLLARVVAAWGACPGGLAEDVLIPADRWNAVGYWEAREVVELDDELLARVDASWFLPPDAGAERVLTTLAIDSDYAEHARVLMHGRRANATRVWFLKDPRFTFLLPFWRRFWPHAVFVVALRNPLTVAASLLRRNHMPTSAGLLLWNTSMRSAVRGTNGTPRLFVDVDKLIAAPAPSCHQLWRQLAGMTGVEPLTHPAAGAECIEPRLWNCPPATETSLPIMYSEILAWYEDLRRHAGTRDAETSVELGPDYDNLARDYLRVWGVLSRIWQALPAEARQEVTGGISVTTRRLFAY